MQLLKVLRSKDKKLDYLNYQPRKAGRVILFKDQKVALIYVSTHKYYMLPGGGIEKESIQSGLKREVREEIGCQIKIISEVGKIISYIERWKNIQTDYCFIAKVTKEIKDISLTSFEKSEGHQIVWAKNIKVAIDYLKNSKPQENDGKIIQKRDYLFLKTALNNIQLGIE